MQINNINTCKWSLSMFYRILLLFIVITMFVSIFSLVACQCFPSSHGWTRSNPLLGPSALSYGFQNLSDERIEIIIPNIIDQTNATKGEIDFELRKSDKKFQRGMPLGPYCAIRSQTTRTLYRLDKNQELTCRVVIYDEDEITVRETREYKIGLRYPDGFWDKGDMHGIQFFYDREQLWVSFWDIDEQFNPCLNDGTPFRLWHYMIYGWFHPDTSVKEYIKLPEETRTFTPEEVQEALQVIDDLKHQYYHNTSSIEERKEIRRKIEEKLKQEYPIR